jgi:hypothetical protein
LTILSELQIVAGIGEIEALVAQREIGDAVFPYGDGQTLPVVKRRVYECFKETVEFFLGRGTQIQGIVRFYPGAVKG